MAQTTAEFLIEQGKAEGKQDAILKLLQLQNNPHLFNEV